MEELFSEEGVGTMVHTDSYREIRPLKEEDIPELLSMLARSVVDSKLVNRNYEAIAARMDDYYVLTLDAVSYTHLNKRLHTGISVNIQITKTSLNGTSLHYYLCFSHPPKFIPHRVCLLYTSSG